MALTMTRTRTQTALTKLVELVANVHGELETVERLLAEARAWVAEHESSAMPRHESSEIAWRSATSGKRTAARAQEAEMRRGALERRRQVLLAQRESLYAAVRQFDAELEPTSIGSTQTWLKQYGRGGGKAAQARYLRSLETMP